MITYDDNRQYKGIRCDTCPTEAPPAREILDGHGLNNMGWWCAGGRHICTNCEHPEGQPPGARRAAQVAA